MLFICNLKINIMVKKIYLFIVSALLLTAGLNAQVTTSSITGNVSDENGSLQGATVTVTHLPSGTVSRAFTQNQGSYLLQGLRPGGPYRVEVSYTGYFTEVINDISLVLGEPYRLNVTMKPGQGTNLEEVVVAGISRRNSILNSDRTGASTNISNTTISRMPTIDRSISDFTRLTPQANGNSFAGRDGRMNNLQIDGANFNNGFGLSSNPLPGGSNQPVSLDAIQEVSVNIAPYDVRQTGFTGAGINAITRSGTNNIEGSVYTFLRPKSFSGLNVGDAKLPEAGRNQNRIIGARIGLPIIKNKLFFFGSFENENQLNSGNNWLAARAGVSGPNVTRVAAADLDAVANYLKTNYNYDPGAYEGYANNYENKNNKILARLDWNISDKNKFTLRFNTMTGTSDQETNATSGPNPRGNSNRISKNAMSFENANYKFKNIVTSLTGELNTAFSSAISNQFLVTYSKIQDTRSTPGATFPMVDIWNGGDNYISFGTELFSYNNEVINNNVSVTNNLTYLIGKHTLTGGLSFESKSFANSYMRMGTSYYRFNNLQTFLNGGKPDVFGVTYLFDGKDNFARVKFATAGGYLQDKIAITRNFNLTAGLRIDKPIFLNDPYHNPVIDTIALMNQAGERAFFSTASWPNSKLLFSPRLGFNWDAKGDRTLQVRGGTGIFTGNIPFVWFTNMPTNSGMIQNTFEPVTSPILAKITGFNPDPMHWVNTLASDFPKSPSTKAPGSFALVDKSFKMPSVWRTSLGADWKIPSTRLIITGDLIYSKDINGVYQYNANRVTSTGTLTGAGGDNRGFWANANAAKYNSITGTIIPVLSNPDEKGNSLSATIGVTLQETSGISGSLFYTHTNSRDITGNPGSAANSAWSNNYSINDPNEQLMGYSQFAVPNRIVGNLSYRIEYAKHFATTVSLFYNGSSQGRFAYTYSNDLNQDGVSMDLLYVPNKASDLKFVDNVIKNSKTGDIIKTFTAAEQIAAFDAFIDANEGLKNARGKYVDRNVGLMPWYNRWDFKFLQDFFVKTGNRKHNLQLSLDILNVGNFLNKDWGVLKQLNLGNSYAYGVIKRAEYLDANLRTQTVAIDANGVPSLQMNAILDAAGNYVLPKTPYQNLFSPSSTWGMQLGIRYSF